MLSLSIRFTEYVASSPNPLGGTDWRETFAPRDPAASIPISPAPGVSSSPASRFGAPEAVPARKERGLKPAIPGSPFQTLLDIDVADGRVEAQVVRADGEQDHDRIAEFAAGIDARRGVVETLVAIEIPLIEAEVELGVP